MERQYLKFSVAGKVQGVGFRSHVLALAQDLGLSGEVYNERSGGVAGVVIGPSEVIDQFRARLREGPGSVDRVSFEPIYVSNPYAGFIVTKSR